VPDTSGRYRILGELGSGGMGVVYLAEDRSLRRRVALKKLAPSRLNDDSRRVLLHEARAIARLNHPNIAAIHDVVDEADGSYLVMEYVPGRTLSERIREGPLTPTEAVRLSRQIAGALAAAHEHGVIHRDLKPANIHLMPSGDVKILDFGLARTVHGEFADPQSSTTSMSDPLGREANIVGTLPYIAPEILLGARADARADIYSFGVTLFQLLSGELPFRSENRMTYVTAVTSREAPQVTEFDPSIPEPVARLVARSLARDPAARFQSATELGDELARLESRKPAVRRLAMTGVTVLVAVAAIALVVTRTREMAPESAPSPVVAVLPFIDIGADSAAGYVAAGLTDIVASRLAQLPLTVAPPGRSGRYRGGDRNTDSLAAELGASLIVDGSVQQYGEALRISLKLLRRGSNRIDWSRSFDGELTAALRLQEDVLGGLVDGLVQLGTLEVPPAASERHRVTRPPTANEEANADYVQARAFLERDDQPENVRRAVRLFESALRRDPGFAAARGGLAEAYWAMYRKSREQTLAEAALQAAGNAVTMDTTDARARLSLAVILLGTGRLDEADVELARVAREQPRNDRVRSLLGDLHERAGRRVEAERHYREAVGLRPAYWEYHWQLGRFLLRNGRLDEAEASARRAAELQPDNALGHQLLGTVLQTNGRIEEAVASYERSLALTPNASAVSNIGGSFFDAGDYRRAVDYYRRAVELDPRLPVYRRNLGDALLENGERLAADSAWSAGVALSDSLLAVNPRDANTTALKALCLAKLGRAEPALAAIALARVLNSTSANVRYKEAAVLALLERPDAAIVALERALESGLPATVAAADRDLVSISSRDEFRQLVNRHTDKE
jgi:tetratricopeptide (TPR) repeat protein